jgi:hypothetical protein
MVTTYQIMAALTLEASAQQRRTAQDNVCGLRPPLKISSTTTLSRRKQSLTGKSLHRSVQDLGRSASAAAQLPLQLQAYITKLRSHRPYSKRSHSGSK